jgi:hypothetical protein
MKTLTDFLSEIVESDGLAGTVVYAGCGRLQQVALLAGLAKKIILFESDITLKDFNLDAISDFPQIQYVCKPLWNAATSIFYQQYNVSRFNGLKKVIDLNHRYPNLKWIGEVELTTKSLDQLELPSESNPLILVLDLNGTELEFLSQLSDKTRSRISQVILALPEVGLYDSEYTDGSLSRWAKDNCWFVVEHLPCSDSASFVSLKPEFPQNTLVTVNGPLEFEEEIAELKADNQRLSQKNQVLTQENQTLITELEAKQKQVTEDFEAKQLNWQRTNDELAQAHKKQVAELEKKYDETLRKLTQKAAELETQNKRLAADSEVTKTAMRDLEQRQRLMNEELVRGEAQLTLIKDMLLRDSAF